jgi:hypothetical protein
MGHHDHADRDPCPAWLLDALSETIYRSPAKPARIAELMGCSPDLLYAYATDPTNRSAKHWHFPLYRLVPLVWASQNPILLDVLEAQVGRTAQAVQHVPRAALPDMTRIIAGKAGDWLTTMAQVMEDGVLSGEERQALSTVSRQLHEILARFDVALLRHEQE